MNNEELDAIRERAEAATNINDAGWYVDDEYPDTIRDAWECELIAQCARGKEADAEFIAHARNDIPKLLAEVERLSTELQAYRKYSSLYVADRVNGFTLAELIEKKLLEGERL